jgi:hypothetical protein
MEDIKAGLIRFAWKDRVETANLAEAYMMATLKEIKGVSPSQYEEAKEQVDAYFTKERAEARELYAERLRQLS